MVTSLFPDPGEGLGFGSVFLLILIARPGEQADGLGNLLGAGEFAIGDLGEPTKSRGTIRENVAQRARPHFFKPQSQSAIDGAAGHRLPGQEQGIGAGRTVIVHIKHRDTGHSDPVKRPVTRSTVSEHPTDVGLLHQAIVQAGIRQG